MIDVTPDAKGRWPRLRGDVSLAVALAALGGLVAIPVLSDDGAESAPADHATAIVGTADRLGEGAPADANPGPRKEVRRPPQATIDAISKLVESQTFGDYYMLRIDPSTSALVLLVSTDFPPGTRADVHDVAEEAGVRLKVRALVAADSHLSRQEKLDSSAEAMQTIATRDLSYGFSFLKIEVAWRTIVVWRKEPNAATDAALQHAADQANVTLELRTSTYSKRDIDRIGGGLVAENVTWRRHGFVVTGFSPNPWGVLVYASGSQENAERILLRDERILAIKSGDVIPL